MIRDFGAVLVQVFLERIQSYALWCHKRHYSVKKLKRKQSLPILLNHLVI